MDVAGNICANPYCPSSLARHTLNCSPVNSTTPSFTSQLSRPPLLCPSSPALCSHFLIKYSLTHPSSAAEVVACSHGSAARLCPEKMRPRKDERTPRVLHHRERARPFGPQGKLRLPRRLWSSSIMHVSSQVLLQHVIFHSLAHF